jgi:hypothetical protein
MIDGSYFKMLFDYKSKGFEKHFNNAIIQGLKNEMNKGTAEITNEIEYSLTKYQEEDKQLFEVATYIQDYIRLEVEKAQEQLDKMNKPKITNGIGDNNEVKLYWVSVCYLSDLLGNIAYHYIDYYEVAKQLTKLYKENQKTQIKKVA